MKLIKLVLLSMLLVILNACSALPSNINNQQRDVAEQGKASFYADKYHGRLTASGERFSQQAATAAHLKLPFGTRVNVTNIANNKSVVVRINDRGPYIRGRIIDLSKAMFKKIADPKVGVINVTVTVIDKSNTAKD
jgi:rare lipoprotein A